MASFSTFSHTVAGFREGSLTTGHSPLPCAAMPSSDACLSRSRAHPRADMPGSRSAAHRRLPQSLSLSQSLWRAGVPQRQQLQHRGWGAVAVRAAHSGSGGLGGSMQEDFEEDDKEYARASVLAATEVKSGADGFLVKMADGSQLRCAHNTSDGTRLPDYAAQPAIVLKLEDGSDLLLPLIVLEHPRATLMEAMKNLPLARPTVYLVIRDMIELMGYELKLVRVTHRVCEAYYARIYLAKVGDEAGSVISLDLRPSDAINLAVRAKVPIQVHKALAVGDGVRQVSMVPRGASRSVRAIRSYHFTWTAQDRPDSTDSATTSEFSLIQMLEVAVTEERFGDAAKIRDQLKAFRTRTAQKQD